MTCLRKHCGCTWWQPPQCTPAPLPRTPVCWWEGAKSGTDGSPPQPPPHCYAGWHGNAYSSGPGGCHDAHSSRLRSRWPQPSEHESYNSTKPRERRKCGRTHLFLCWDVSNKIKEQIHLRDNKSVNNESITKASRCTNTERVLICFYLTRGEYVCSDRKVFMCPSGVSGY